MRALSAARIKAIAAHKTAGGKPPQLRPLAGTRLGDMYDMFYSAKGRIIEYSSSSRENAKMEQLRNIYCLDIRNVGHCKWLLAGEWDGKVYIDYVAERHRESD